MIDIDGIKMYSTEEISDMTGVTLGTVAKWRKDGLITSIQIGRKKYTSEESFKDFLTGRTQARISKQVNK